jgi:hypothetical protein
LESVSEDVLDPDTAVKELEAIAFQLQQLDLEERREFVAFVEREADVVPEIVALAMRGSSLSSTLSTRGCSRPARATNNRWSSGRRVCCSSVCE